MSQISKQRIIIGWLAESLWAILFSLVSLFTLFLSLNHKPGRRRETIVIVCDAFASIVPYLRLAGALNRAGFPVYTISTGHVFQSLRVHARKLGEVLKERGISDAIILGHGQGGLIPLSMPDAGRQRIQHLVALGSAFYGSRLFMSTPFIPALRDMGVGSEYLLFHRMNCMLFGSFTPLSAWQDQWIVPFNLSRFGQGRDLVFDRVGHYSLVMNGENITTIVSILTEHYPDPQSAVEQAQLQISQGDAGARHSAQSPARKKTSTGKKKKATPSKKKAKKKTGKKSKPARRR